MDLSQVKEPDPGEGRTPAASISTKARKWIIIILAVALISSLMQGWILYQLAVDPDFSEFSEEFFGTSPSNATLTGLKVTGIVTAIFGTAGFIVALIGTLRGHAPSIVTGSALSAAGIGIVGTSIILGGVALIIGISSLARDESEG